MSGLIIFNFHRSQSPFHSRRPHRGKKQPFRKLILESLEDRRVLAAAPLTGASYTQNFDSLQSTGTTDVVGGLFPDGANVMQGWAFAETGSNANTSYIAGTGGNGAGDTYSFGVAGTNALTDRALGTIQSGSLISTIGASFQNVTATTFDSIRVSYTGEQWRLGALGRSDLFDFQFSTNATSLTTGTWTDVNALDFVAPITTGTLGALDGNAAANRITLSNVAIPGLTLAPNATFWIRWTDLNASGTDDGLAIDNFSIATSDAGNAGVSILETGGATSVTEGAATDTYTIALQSAPTSNVTIAINSGSQVTTAPTTVTFTPANWSVAQTVTVTAVNDIAVEGTHFGTITHSSSSSDIAYNSIAIPSVAATITDNDGTPTSTNLRVVSYNIASEFGAIRTGLNTLLQGIGTAIVAGFARQVDLIALQEVDLVQTATSTIASQLNAIYGAGIYVSGTLAGLTTGAGTQGVVYNSQTLQLLGEATVGTINSSGQARQTLRHHFQPLGGGANTDFYVYNSHWKSADNTADEARRLVEVQAIRANADALGNGKNILYVGDFNVYRGSESGFQAILAGGNGQAFDPVNRVGNWSGNSNFVDLFTQAPSANPPAGFTSGGLDDRFDFQLISGELTDSTGLEYRTGSYHTYGNNGSVPVNGSINDPISTALPGVPNRTTLLNLLTTVSDHLPVVADYTFSSFTDTTPPTVSIDDGDADNSVFVNSPLQYTLTFSEGIQPSSINAADFNNAGTALISIGAITQVSPSVYSVTVTPTSAGTIILRIPTGAVISDLAGNNLVVPVQDGDVVTAVALANPTLTITSGNRVYNNAAYAATSSISGANAPQPSVSFVYYSNAAGTNIIAAPTNVGSYFVRAFAAANVGNNAAQSAITPFQITPLAITGNITAANKVFDGTTSATILTRSLVGVLLGDAVTYSGGTATFDSAAVGNNRLVTATGLSMTGADAINYTVNTTATTTANITQPVATIANRRVFYNNAPGPNLSSAGAANAAIASDKSPLLPGESSGFANYTNYVRGLNGVIVDINNLPSTTTDTQILASLQFAQWNGIAVAGFSSLPGAAIPSATILAGSGIGGSARVKITFPDDSLRNTWLRVTVLANANTGLASDDVFYFGNVVGELDFGNTATRLRVNGQDTNRILLNQSPGANSASVTNIYDVDRNGRVNGQDTNVLLTNQQAAGIVAPITVPPILSSAASVDSNVMRIINGSGTTLYPSVGTVGDSSFGQYCTGTLIASQYVLTAAHCAVDGSSVVGDTAGRVRLGTTTYPTSRVIVHPGYSEAQFGTDAANDIAIYKLASPITTITPSNLFRQTPTVGTLMTLVGFGGGGTGNTGTDGSFGTKRVGTTPIDSVSSTLIHWNFDNNTESNTAPGDSGGPSFINVGGELQVAGVTSGGTLASAAIGDESYNTRVDAYLAWIDGVLAGETTSNVIDYVTAGSTYTQSFDTLATTGTSSVLPSGWILGETGTNANATYTAGNGNGTAGDTYSFGATSATDRALGSLLSGSLSPVFGAAIKNSTGAAITSMTISYRGEQWRLGTTGRADRLDFQYSTDATTLSDGTWINSDTLDFSSPATTGTLGPLNGNAAVNQSNRSATIGGLNIPIDATIWIRFVDSNASGADDGLAIDDFVFSATGVTKSTPAITATPLTKIYDGQAFSIAANADDGPGGSAPDTSGFTYTFYAAANLSGGTIVAPENVGTYSVNVAYAGNANYNAVASTAFNFSITSKSLLGNITAANKVFDGTTAASILTRSLIGVVPGDVVNYVGGTATFDTATVGNGKTVTAIGLSLSGADASNYSVNPTATTTANITSAVATIANRRVFYNNATGTNLSSQGAADAAIASDKSPLFSGASSSFSNYTNYSRGLNGVIVDVQNLPATTTDSQILASLQFAQWNGISAGGFAALPGAAIPSATVLPGSGVGGSARVKITFPDNTLRNTWLQITVLANAQTGLAANDVFYFGNVIADVNMGNTATRLRVNGQDTNQLLLNQSAGANSASITNIFDFNRDGRVNGQDTNVMLANQQAAGIVAPITTPPILSAAFSAPLDPKKNELVFPAPDQSESELDELDLFFASLEERLLIG